MRPVHEKDEGLIPAHTNETLLVEIGGSTGEMMVFSSPHDCCSCPLFRWQNRVCLVTHLEFSYVYSGMPDTCPLIIADTSATIRKRDIGYQSLPPEKRAKAQAYAVNTNVAKCFLEWFGRWKRDRGCISSIGNDPTTNCVFCSHSGIHGRCPVRTLFIGYAEYREAVGEVCFAKLMELQRDCL